METAPNMVQFNFVLCLALLVWTRCFSGQSVEVKPLAVNQAFREELNAIPKTKQHQFKCGLVVRNGFRPEHLLVFLWPRLQRKKFITIKTFKQFSPLCNCFLFAKQTKLAAIRHPEWPYQRMRLISWSNVAQNFFDLVKSSNFYAPSKYVKMRPFWFATEFNGAWVEGRMWRKIENTMIL